MEPAAEAACGVRHDPYRERGTILLVNEGHQVGEVDVQGGKFWTKIDGVLWWRRWSAPIEGSSRTRV